MYDMLRRRRPIVIAAAVAVAVAAVLLSSGASASRAPRADAAASQTINAQTNPQQAGQAINDFCAVISNCKFVGGQPTVKYADARVLGDALYNCGQSDAEDEVTISDRRSESTSVDEELSASVKLGFLGLEKTSIEAEVHSKQLDEVATETEQRNSVSVEPGEVGYTETQVPTAYINGTAYVTDGVNLITITNVELTYPGYGNQAINKIQWTDVHRLMDEKQRAAHCDQLPALAPASAALTAPRPNSDAVVLCAGSGACTGNELISDNPLPITAGTRLTLARGTKIYASGTAGKRRIVLHRRRPVGAGTYTLIVSSRRRTTLLEATLR
jgi:hypothetical protein